MLFHKPYYKYDLCKIFFTVLVHLEWCTHNTSILKRHYGNIFKKIPPQQMRIIRGTMYAI